MKKLITSNIVTPVKQPITKASLDLIQASYKEVIDALMLHPAFDKGRGQYSILSGLEVSYDEGNVIIGDGAIYANIADAQILIHENTLLTNPGNGETLVCYKVVEYDANDPIQLSDLNEVYVHQNTKLVIEYGIDGVGGNVTAGYTYLCDFSALAALPDITAVYPNAIVDTDITNMAITGETSVNVTGFTTVINYTATTLSQTVNQFNDYTIDAIVTQGGGYVNAGWQQFGTLPANKYPEVITQGNYINSCTMEKTGVFSVVPLKIGTDGKVYFYNPDAGGTPILNVHLRYEL